MIANYLLARLKMLTYVVRGRVPWTRGYGAFRDSYISKALSNRGLMSVFQEGRRLPLGYGVGLDERVIEFPWVLSRLLPDHGAMLDAGSALNHSFLIENSVLKNRQLVVYTLSPHGEEVHRRSNISYIYGDLRHTILRDRIFQDVVSISTIEHVGLDNTRFYTSDGAFKESDDTGFIAAIAELHRVLVPGGRLLLTVPYGRRQQLGWLQVFDRPALQRILTAFGGTTNRESYYRYERGWQIASPDDCVDCDYYDHHVRAYEDGWPAAAGAVACLELVKTS